MGARTTAPLTRVPRPVVPPPPAGATRPLHPEPDAFDDPTPLDQLGPDVDWVIVQRACDGQHVAANVHERRQIIRRLHRRGLTDAQMTALTGIAERRVWGLRTSLGLGPVASPTRSDNLPVTIDGVRRRRNRRAAR